MVALIKPPSAWDQRVGKTLDSVRREANLLMWLGFLVYGGGSAAIMYFMRAQPALATLCIMYLFQMLVLFFGTRKMYPAITGGFRTSLEANRNSVPLFEKIAKGVEELESNPEAHPVVKAIGDRFEKIISAKSDPVIQRWERIGERVEKVLLPRLEEAIAKADAKISSTTEGVKRVQQMVEGELATGLLQELREASFAVKLLAAPHAPTRDFEGMIDSLGGRKPRNGASPAIPVAPQGGH